MKVLGLNGREYNLNLKKYIRNRRSTSSFYHVIARELMGDVFLGYNILEEVKLPGSGSRLTRSPLFLDFLIPNLSVAVEVHGQQHYKYIPFFHKTRAGFLRSQVRDNHKEEWCQINNIELVVLKYNDSEEHWRNQLERCR